jgi:hypothetical protein
MYRLFFCLLLVAWLRGEIVDRIAITVGRQVITELQIDEELRVTAFQNHVPISGDIETRRAAADRIVAQRLVDREMDMSHYPAPDPSDIQQYVERIRNGFMSETAYRQALNEYRITEPILSQHLANQLATLSFIELRFRPNLDLPEADIETFYNREIATWKTEHPGIPPPSFAAARSAILKTLIEEHTDEILDTWLEEARKQVSITYLDRSLE